jgi:hypothetical protein
VRVAKEQVANLMDYYETQQGLDIYPFLLRLSLNVAVESLGIQSAITAESGASESLGAGGIALLHDPEDDPTRPRLAVAGDLVAFHPFDLGTGPRQEIAGLPFRDLDVVGLD